MGTCLLRKAKGWADVLQLRDSRYGIRTQILLRPKCVSLLCHVLPGWVQGWEESTEYPYPGPHQASSCAALLPCGTTIYQLQAWAPSCKSEEQSASCTLACTVIDGETQCHCGWEDSWGKACRQHHSHDDLISVNRAWLLTQPQWEWAQGWGSSSPRGILLWHMGCGPGASLRESAGFIHSLQACPPLRGATVDSICSQFWQGSLIMS